MAIEKGEIIANFSLELSMGFEGQNYALFFLEPSLVPIFRVRPNRMGFRPR